MTSKHCTNSENIFKNRTSMIIEVRSYRIQTIVMPLAC